MELRSAEITDRAAIVGLFERSQAATQIPDPLVVPPETLETYLYSRHAVERYVADVNGAIVGHGMIEEPNPEHIAVWRQALETHDKPLLEMGGAFVDPELAGRGIWRSLLQHRLQIIRGLGAVPVSATWVQNEHVKKVFHKEGGIAVGEQCTPGGPVSLFTFVA